MVKKMVIAKPEWFKKKNRASSIFDIPLKGWIYNIIAMSVIFIGVMLPQNIITETIVAGVFLFLIMDENIVSLKSLDEREHMHYAIAMRNMAWGVLIIMITGSIILINNFNGTDIKTGLYILIMITAVGGALINNITRHKLEKEN